MKLKKTKIENNRIFELYLIKNQIHKQQLKKKNEIEKLFEHNLYQTILSFKKVLNIIYEYNQNNKQILFLGTPKNKNTNNINKKTRHTAISNLFSIKYIQNNNLKKNKLFKITIKPDLIISFDQNKNIYKSILKENCNKKIPIINFTSNNFKHSFESYYCIPVNEELIKNNIFFIIICNMLRKFNNKTIFKKF